MSHLDTLVNLYLSPLSNPKTLKKLNLTEEDVRGVFSCLPVIAQFHKALLNDLTTQASTGRIAQVFLRLADYLKAYREYLNNYEKVRFCMQHKSCVR
mgnify:CR=1 FL=1